MSSAGQIVGGAIGYFVGGAFPIGAALGAQIGITIGGLIDPPRLKTQHGPRLSDLTVQTSTSGAPIPRIYGTVATHGNVFWVEGDRLKESVKKTKSGGKGGGGQTTKTYSYSATFAVGLCKGPIAGVRRIWVGAKLIYDAGSEDLEAIIASNQAASGFKIYLGDETQLPNPRMQADKGVSNTPGYRGLAYIVFYDLGLGEYGNSLMGAQVKVEVVKSQTSSGPQLISTLTTPISDSFNASPTSAGGQNSFSVSFADMESSGVYRDTTVSDGFLLSKYAPTNITGYSPPNNSPYNYGPLVRTSPAFNSTYRLNTPEGVTHYYRYSDAIDVADFHVWVRKDLQIYGLGNQIRIRRLTPVDSGAPANSSIQAETSLVFSGAGGLNSVLLHKEGEAVIFIFNNTVYFFDETSLVLIETRVHTSSILSDQKVVPCFGSDGRVYVSNNSGSSISRLTSDLTGVEKTWTLPSGNFASNSLSLAIMGNVLLRAGARNTVFGVVAEYWLLESAAGNQIPLSSIIQSETLQSQLITPSDINTSTLTDQARGYRVSETSPIRNAINPLQAAWPFDVVQRGYQLHFVRRPKAPVATVDEFIGEFKVDREMDARLPRTVAVSYLDVDREYQ